MNGEQGQLATSTSSLTLASNASSVHEIDYTLESSEPPMIDDTYMEDADTPDDTGIQDIPRTSPTSYLGNPDLFVPNLDFFLSIQDKGKPNLDDATNRPYKRKPK